MKRVSTGVAARRLGVSVEHVRRLIFCGDLDALDTRLPGSTIPRYSVTVDSIERFERSRSTGKNANSANGAK